VHNAIDYKLYVKENDPFSTETSGVSTKLYKCTWNDNIVAIKVQETQSPKKESIKKSFFSEVICLSLISHKNIVTLYGANYSFEKDSTVYYFGEVLEYHELGNLRTFLSNDENRFKTLNECYYFCLDICIGMEFLHSLDLTHKDLKPENLLVAKFPHRLGLKIGDIGTTKLDNRTSTLTVGTPGYLPPEIDNKNLDLDVDAAKTMDVFSFGVIFWELISREQVNDNQIKTKKYSIPQKFEKETVPCDEITGIVNLCCNLRPNKRPTFSVLVQDMKKLLKLYR